MHRREILKFSAMLLGASISGSVSRALAAGVTAGTATTSKVFDESRQTTVSLLAEMIIPTTDTPGAVTAGVPEFIAEIVGHWYNDAEREIFLSGLAELDQFCIDAEDQPFHGASETSRRAALDAQQASASEYKGGGGGGASHPMAKHHDSNAPFFAKLKELVVLGYYTSEVGAKEELIYLPMPGYYDGDFDFDTVGRQWIS